MEEQLEMEQGLTPQETVLPKEQKTKRKKEKKKGKHGAWKAIVAVVLLLGTFGSIAVSSFTLLTLKDFIVSQEKDDEKETTEDYVKIAEQYEILPTTEISDAYKSGDTSALDDKQKETLDMAKAALEKMDIKDGMSDFEKEKAVYDWMTTSLQQDRGALVVIPTTNEDCDKPYGVLKYHNAVCVGYATTFRLFMEMLDIECMVEHNVERWHSWNLVKLDGDWYITDIYSDAGNNTYAHFNMTDSMWGQQQNWDHSFFPAANSLKYNMSYRNKETVDTIYDAGTAIRNAMNKKLGSVMIGFKEEVNDDKARIVSSIVNGIDNALMENSYQDMPYGLNGWGWVQDPEDNKYLLNVSFGGYNSPDNPSEELSEEEQAKVQEILDKLFEDLNNPGTEGGTEGGMEGDMPEGNVVEEEGVKSEEYKE